MAWFHAKQLGLSMHLDNSIWEKNNYSLKITDDGSPSLRYLGSEHGESMHHSGGAWSETWYIYGLALQAAFRQGASSVLSVGLGLGYNELLSVRVALENKIQGWHLQSFEKDPFLAQEFLNYLGKRDSDTQSTYDCILSFVSPPVEKSRVLEKLQQMSESKDFAVKGHLQLSALERSYSVILYDAFSSKATPELWQEDFLENFLLKTAGPNCILSTYACTGGLKRSLKKNGFQVHERLGFQGKRSSIIASRGFILGPDLIA